MTQLTRANLVTGLIGAGKTTVILRLLAQRPAHERWAVLTNEFGAVRLDAGPDVAVREVPGGCVCCTAQVSMRVALTRLMREVRPDRLLLEPTSAGHLANVLRLLREPSLQRALQLGATLCVVDPDQFARSEISRRDNYRGEIALADVVIVNKCDVASRSHIDAVLAYAHALEPPKLAIVETALGNVDAALLDAGIRGVAIPTGRGQGVK